MCFMKLKREPVETIHPISKVIKKEKVKKKNGTLKKHTINKVIGLETWHTNSPFKPSRLASLYNVVKDRQQSSGQILQWGAHP